VSAVAAGLAYREAVPEGPSKGDALFLHGYPESSFMWREAMRAAEDAGWRAVAPDLPGFGDSVADPPGTWERHIEAVERFRTELGLERVALVVHDWGGLIGLRWACDHPEAVRALVISDTGFFADGKWHGLALAMRTEGQGEELVEQMTLQGLAGALRAVSPGVTDEAVAHYFKAFGDEERRRGQLELYRSGDFEKLGPYEGRLAALGVPTLLEWGENDPFAPVASAHRLAKEIPGAQLDVVEGAGHFVWEDAPGRTAEALAEFLEGLPPS
jgi:haloalkane dehalogenase